MSIDRRKFLASSGLVAVNAIVPSISRLSFAENSSEQFQWQTNDLTFAFEVKAGKLRQKRLVPTGVSVASAEDSSGVEVALQCSGENSPDQGMKSGMGQPGRRLLLDEHREEMTRTGKRLVFSHNDSALKLRIESIYDSIDGVPLVRRYLRVINDGNSPVGIEFLSSAMLHGLANPQGYDHEMRIHVAVNSWMAEGQW